MANALFTHTSAVAAAADAAAAVAATRPIPVFSKQFNLTAPLRAQFFYRSSAQYDPYTDMLKIHAGPLKHFAGRKPLVELVRAWTVLDDHLRFTQALTHYVKTERSPEECKLSSTEVCVCVFVSVGMACCWVVFFPTLLGACLHVSATWMGSKRHQRGSPVCLCCESCWHDASEQCAGHRSATASCGVVSAVAAAAVAAAPGRGVCGVSV